MFRPDKKLLPLILFGIAFGFVEAAVVSYLNGIAPFTPFQQALVPYTTLLNLGFITFIKTVSPILASTRFTQTEMQREAATIVMLAAVSVLAAKTMKRKIGAFLITFAVWDIFYYIFLAALTGWPKSIFDTDVFFLLPVTWIGPVITPVVISVLLCTGGLILFLQ